MMQQSMINVKGGMIKQMLGVKLTADQYAKLDTFTAQVNKIVSDALAWQVLEPEYVKLYADAYTEEELDGIAAFLRICERASDGEKGPGADAAVGRNGATAPAGRRATDSAVNERVHHRSRFGNQEAEKLKSCPKAPPRCRR
jgi:uncharacterized protein (UPF0254 family)